jgi:hypothetical protein
MSGDPNSVQVQSTTPSDSSVVPPPVEVFENKSGSNIPIDSVVPNQTPTTMSPASLKSGGNCMLRSGGRKSKKQQKHSVRKSQKQQKRGVHKSQKQQQRGGSKSQKQQKQQRK